MKDEAKVKFLRRREYSLDRAVEGLESNVNAIADHEMYAKEFSEFATRLEACLRDLKKIRAAIGDKADELGGAA
jgi:hypothetical protein